MSNIVIMPDGTPVDVTGIPEEQVVAMIEASRKLAPPAPPPDSGLRTPEKPAVVPETDYMNRENLLSTREGLMTPGTPFPADMAEDALIGAGRFINELGQGIKQKYLQSTNQAEADEYTDEVINPDTERWDKGTEGAGMEDIGYYGAAGAPGMAFGGGAGIVGTGVLAGIESGLMPTENATWEEAAKNATTGAAFGAALRSAPDVWAAQKSLRNWFKNKNINKNLDSDMVALAEKYGVKIPRSWFSPSKPGQVAEELGQIPFVGRVGVKKMLEDAQKAFQQMLAENKPAQKIQQAWNKQKELIEKADKKAWDITKAAIGDSGIDRQNVNNMMNGILRGLRGDNIGKEQIGEEEAVEIAKLLFGKLGKKEIAGIFENKIQDVARKIAMDSNVAMRTGAALSRPVQERFTDDRKKVLTRSIAASSGAQ